MTLKIFLTQKGFPGSTSGKESAFQSKDIGDAVFIPGSKRSSEGRIGNPLQYSCLDNSMDRRSWWATVVGSHRVILAWRIPWTEELGGLQSAGCKESDTTERLHFHFLGLCLSKLLGFSFLNCKVRVLLRLGVRTH